MPAKTVTLDREIVERFIVEVDALARFEAIRNGGQATFYQEHVYSIIEPFERAAFGRMSEERSQELHRRGGERGRELAREIFAAELEREGGKSDAS